MIRKLFTTLFLFTLPILLFSQKSYIEKYRPVSDSLSKEFNIPSDVILAIAIIESGAGTSKVSVLLNNHFGIIGRNNLWKTKKIKSRYKQYNNAAASYADFCRLMTKKKFYKTLRGNMNNLAWVDAISKSGYSEMPTTWKKRVQATIQKLN